jgi:hypothetical protein
MSNDHIIGGIAGLALAWYLLRKPTAQTPGEQIAVYETMVAQGVLSHTVLPVVIDMFAQGATSAQVQAYVASAGSGSGSGSGRAWIPTVTPAPVFIPNAPGQVHTPSLTWEPECLNDLDCHRIYGPEWICVQGRCVKLFKTTEEPLDQAFTNQNVDETFLGRPPF